ncbi:hypothetical protein IV203_009285 [Nitzschia inconspicua]|uniref:Uncharacterized protein n=1 Tax=Nitzschia inconspicua TaxID=303405 RepID=A0A9K3L1W4_9STRA|nr:hypothetical protein IV203_009285 [Nitzschia inconspicua]
MKMRSKRDQRPLLTQEAPILSDQMDPSNDEVNEEDDFLESHSSQQPSKDQKKRSWRRLFGKNNNSSSSSSKRKENQNQRTENGNLASSSQSSSSDSGDHSTQKRDQQANNPSQQYHHQQPQQQQRHGVSPQAQSDKRDDGTESSQNTSHHIKDILDHHVDDDGLPSPIDYNKGDKTDSQKAPFVTLSSPAATTATSSPAAISTVTQQHRNHISPRHMGSHSIAPTSTRSATSRSTTGSRRTTGTRSVSLVQQVRHKRSASALRTATAATNKMLSRPFGREHILTTEQTWVVHVGRAEWDSDESMWKYRVNIKKKQGDKLEDFASGFPLRSLQDFHWLEQALTAEFFGGLLLPSLSIYLGVSDISNCQHEIDSRLLMNWLSDTLNGIRGQGEIMFRLDKVDVTTSESIEAFLYRTDLMQILEMPKSPRTPTPKKEMTGTRGGGSDDWNFFPELCYSGCVKPPSPVKEAIKTPVNMLMHCSSPALGNARTFNVQEDSFVESATFEDLNTSLAIHADLLKAERDLIWSWRIRALQAMEKLRILQEQEKHIGASWKRFAISVSNLFAYEKDVETARLGDSKSRRELQMPYRKLQKSAVDDCLRILALQKVERSIPSIEATSVMLSAYVADLSMVQPSVQAYLEGLQQLANEKAISEKMENSKNPTVPPSETLADRIQASLTEVKKQLTSNQESLHGKGKKEGEKKHLQRQQVQSIENRLLVNESLLKDFMTTLCKTAPVRTTRMMYAFLEKEMTQCVALRAAALDMKSKINVASKENLSKMIQRHHIETKEDQNTELQLVYKIVNIGNSKKFRKDEDQDNAEEVETGVELSQEMAEEEARKTKLRDKAMNYCRDRIGRWDAKVAMSIMEAVGVNDANVRVEETTRDLRMVRKYAIGLRENVQRCSDALDILRMSILQGGVGDIRDLRADFITEMQNLLSLAYVPGDDQSPFLQSKVLEAQGIDVTDPNGWRSNDPGTCGNSINAYIETRDSGTEWLLESLGELLKEYNHRVEAVESFVYMECVGIQLEKHFSQTRATALAAFEKKTDITSAINIATRKKMPILVKELQAKLEAIGVAVSHTTVKEAKEAHLESKALKQELHTLAMRRLTRARETSTERAIALMTVWAQEEEGSTSTEEEILKELILLLQESVKKVDFDVYATSCPARI